MWIVFLAQIPDVTFSLGFGAAKVGAGVPFEQRQGFHDVGRLIDQGTQDLTECIYA
jgi:hypothetical protein